MTKDPSEDTSADKVAPIRRRPEPVQPAPPEDASPLDDSPPAAPVEVTTPVPVSVPPPAEPAPADPVVAEQEIPVDNPEPEEDFATLFEAQMDQAVQQLAEGDKVSGAVIYVGDENVFVGLQGKTEGYIARGELLDEEGNLAVVVGDLVEAYVVGMTPGGVHLSKGIGQSSRALDSLRSALESGVPVEGKVTGVNKGGFEINLLGVRAFCPMSQIDVRYTEDPSVHVGHAYLFRVTKAETRGKNSDVVVSRAALLREERKEKAESLVAEIKVGDVRTGVVSSVRPFGAFVDLGGLDGLVHVSELSWERVDDPGSVIKEGQEVTVKVLSLENLGDPKKSRIGLSIKAVSSSPWEKVGTDFVEGGVYDGVAVRLEPYGAFIELAPGLDGLVHVSELSLSRVSHPREVLEVGQTVRVQIKGIDFNRERIALSIKALAAQPWDTVDERYGEGLEVTGEVEAVEAFGVFVALEPGLTALIPLSELATKPGSDASRDFRKGDSVTAKILSIDKERRRLTLTRREGGQPRGDRPSRSDRGGPRSKRDRGPQVDLTPKASGEMGTFADLFAKKLGRKK